jgi:hypothetical protein
VPIAPSGAQDDGGVVDARDVVLSGCGRVYAFPSSVPLTARDAGVHHLRHRVGYVEPWQEKWLPRGFGNNPLGRARESRVDALKVVLAQTGLRVTGTFPVDDLAPIGLQVMLTGAKAGTLSEVLVAGDGRVFVTRGETHGRRRNHHWVGFVWRSGRHIAALGHSQQSSMTTLHRSVAGAVTRLTLDAGYTRDSGNRSA